MPTTLALSSRMLTMGDDVTVTYNAPGRPVSSIAVIPAGGTAADAVKTLTATGEAGSFTMTTRDLAPGGYDIALADVAGDEIARNQFWVRSTEASVDLTTDKETYAVGQPVTVRWDNGPANRWDWIAVYKAGASDPAKDDYLLWGYTGGHASGALPPAVSGSMTFDGAAQGHPWPLPPGHYVVHYLLTDQYTSAGSTTFRVIH